MKFKNFTISPDEKIKEAKVSLLSQLKQEPVIVFCLPGRQFSGDFLKSWTATIHYLLTEKIKFIMTSEYSSLVHIARAKCLACDLFSGKKQKIFSDVNYTHIMWIDSDIVWKPEFIGQMLLRDVDIVSGLYSHNGEQFVAYKNINDIEYFKKNGSFECLTTKDTSNKDLIEIDYAGMGFMMVKRGIFEAIDYPYFTSESIQLDDELCDIISEDASFCMKAKQKGFKIFADPTIEVGHEKSIIIKSKKGNFL